MIKSFSGHKAFLSNFYPAKVRIQGVEYPTLEHAFVSMKCGLQGRFSQKNVEDKEALAKFVSLTPGQVKRLGREIEIIPTWNNIRLSVMEVLLRLKFSSDNPELIKKLLDTRDENLVEGNSWGDMFWGVYNGVGSNHLGLLLMKVRDSLNNQLGRKYWEGAPTTDSGSISDGPIG
jgi:ribA/ribD-fused uncharacterized protein